MHVLNETETELHISVLCFQRLIVLFATLTPPHGNKARSHGREGVRGQKASSMEARCACIVLLSGVHVFAEAKSWRVQ